MADHLKSASQFSFHIESSYDVVQQSGVKVEFGASRTALVSRPNQLRIDFQKRDGVQGVMLFDGEYIWVHGPDEKVYAKTEQDGDLDEAIDFAVAELRMKAPLADLFSPMLYESATANLVSAYYLGDAVLQGVECDHILFRNDYADFQMWITSDDQPVLQRILITYKEETGQPQYRASFKNWDMSPKNTRSQFDFDPPDDAERIRFYVPAPATDLAQEKES